MTDTIVVGLDGSTSSESALTWALDEASLRRAPITLATAIAPALVADPHVEALYLNAAEDTAVGVLEQAAARALARGVTATTTAVRGYPTPMLIESSRDAAFVVVGRHGRSALSGLLLGSVSSGVSAHGHCPVVVVPDGPADAAAPSSVIVAVEPGSLDAAVWVGAEYATVHGVPLILLAVRADTLGGARWLPDAYTDDPYPRRVDDEMAAMVTAVRSRFPDLTITSQVLVGDPAKLLTEATTGAGLMVLGTRGHAGFAGVLWGSVSQRVLQHGHCPMVVVPGE